MEELLYVILIDHPEPTRSQESGIYISKLVEFSVFGKLVE